MSRKAKPFEAKHSVSELKRRYKRSTCAVERRRVQVIWWLTEGKSRAEALELSAYSGVQFREILKRYEVDGLEGLRDLRHENPGAPTLLGDEELLLLAQEVRKDYAKGKVWNGNRVVEWAKEVLDKEIYPQRAFEYLSQIGFSKQSPRRRHKKADSISQEEYKKRPSPKRSKQLSRIVEQLRPA